VGASMPAAAIEVMRSAGSCDDCFQMRPDLARPLCDVPQPRWVGERYHLVRPRIALVLINPGGGRDEDPSLLREAETFRKFHNTGDYGPIRAYFAVRLARNVPWLAWYRDVFGLRHEEIAQLNVAWCATQQDKYPAQMLNHCFGKHTTQLLRALNPDIVLLSGDETHGFVTRVCAVVPEADVVPTIHFRNRKRTSVRFAEAARVRARIEAWRANAGSPTS
jgi:hypothetical protein